MTSALWPPWRMRSSSCMRAVSSSGLTSTRSSTILAIPTRRLSWPASRESKTTDARRSSRSAAARRTSGIPRQVVALRRAAHTRRTSAGATTRRSALSPLIMRLPACWWKQSCPLSDLLLQVESLAKAFRTRGTKAASVKAVASVSFTLRRGETLGLVGESGCGKSTLSRLILSLLDPDAGRVGIDGIDFINSSGRAKREMRRRIQIVFQDALSSLNPRMTVGTNIAEPMRLQGLGNATSRRAEAQRLLGVVGLRPEHEDRYPHEFSGGQCQRIAIARALILKPEIIVFDEAVSALDVSIRAQILRLILDLQAMFGLSYVFVSHDLGVIKRICDRVAVMYMGQIVEIGPTDVVCREPRHPYTAALLSAIPIADPRRMRVADLGQIEGDTVGEAKPGSCAFEPRCPRRFKPCDKAVPVLLDVGPDHSAACYLNSPGTLRGTL